MKNLAIVTNTHSSNKDMWEAHVRQIQKHMDLPHYFFSDEQAPPELGVKTIKYDKKDKFRTQYLKCLEKVPELFILYLNEDYILYDQPDLEKLNEYLEVLKDNDSLSFIRLHKGVDYFNQPFTKTLRYLDCRNPYFFSQTASLWRKDHLLKIHQAGPDLHIAGNDMSEQFEVAANQVAMQLGVTGAYHYDGETQRGMYHHDSKVFPYIATALIKGDWCSEYKKELTPILAEYNIDESKRNWS